MIDIQVKIHDKFSVEFKVGYVARGKTVLNDFMVNTWIFIPNSLDINPMTYDKSLFYKDIRSNVRLITPIYSLENIAGSDSEPFIFLEKSFNILAGDWSKTNLSDYEYQIKMFSSIVKSATYKEVNRIVSEQEDEEREWLAELYIVNALAVLKKYRALKSIIDKPAMVKQAFNYFRFGDEFLSHVLEQYVFYLLENLKKNYPGSYVRLKERLTGVLKQEQEYKDKVGYLSVEKGSKDNNRVWLHRRNLLKKYIESHLFLKARRKKDGIFVEQIYYSLAAGISMIFATGVAFSFQQRYGNFTMPFFVALVVSYMLKDRIKELVRFYFVHRLAKKYFDNKTVISIKDIPVGWIKEGFDFISESKVPEEVMNMRDRSDLLEADNRSTAEKIILYRNLVRIDTAALESNNQFQVAGINDIMRYNVLSFVQKMDNPQIPLYVLKEGGDYNIIAGEKIYYINFLMQFQYDANINYKRFRLVIDRDGIKEIEKLS